ncbi:uncharacterized protein Z520_00146 [Fonsecaea multimorphosa CBS 102226]|uniref:NmrA-like domain-containing protein n=1 Tax=Fonsecaea multimorphosa CBS 102226 TaxID=1442371 RepID=A0A0D2KJ19_9EURO|nr:uncharacterized protein Z520_00146 [Fonsecaea multimorphosa CBS 102226]KIY03455.1 hypothetical protein Z520_00146 [Fonsecaea multimorphosa CBS 102226]OAL32713.1 hypothetical protein AYO22_00187 [Fonsecaea multimorphosa]
MSSSENSTTSVIIFGPTGNVGSATTLAAHGQGARVFLAMRNPEKAIPGFTPEQERDAGFERVYADLTKPETVQDAVAKTGAKYAFIYVVRSPDHMKASIVALKSAGVEFVVFLSSYTVPDNLSVETISPSNFIAWGHGQVELNLDQVFGSDGYVAVRPGSFATNSLRWRKMVEDGEVKIAYPEAPFDWISPGDIGRVCGAVIAKGPQAVDGTAGRKVIRLCGPEIMSQAAAADTIGRVLGKDLKVTRLNEQEGVDFFVQTANVPEPAARQLISMLKERAEEGKSGAELYESYEEAVANILKYGGRPPTRFHEWVEENKSRFGA